MSKSLSLVRIFTDESGSPDPYNSSRHNAGEKVFTVASVVIVQKEYLVFKSGLLALKNKYKKYLDDKEIKSRSIRRANPKGVDPEDPPDYDFWKYPEGQEKYENFCIEMKELVKKTDFKIISVSTNKEKAQKLHPSKDILKTVMTDLWERLFIHHYLAKIKNSHIVFDPTGRLDDQTIVSSYDNFRAHGSWFIDAERLTIANLKKHIFSYSSDASPGIQLADYCAYPIKRYVEENKGGPFFEEVIKPKLCRTASDRKTGKNIMMGIKISLNR